MWAGMAAGCGPSERVDISLTDAGVGGSGGAGGRDASAGADGSGGAGGTGGSGTGGTGGTGGAGGSGGTGGGPPDAGPLDMAEDRGPSPDVATSPDMRPVDLPPDVAVLPPDMMMLPPDAPAGVNLGMGLITRLKLDEGMGNSTADSAAGMNNGMLSGATWIKPGAPGTKYPNAAALHFDGNDDFVEVGNRNMRGNNQTQSITFWVRYAANLSGARVCVSVTQAGGGEARLKVGFNDGQVRAWKSSGDQLVSTAMPMAGWHHYAYTYDGNNHRLYLDGMQRAMSGTTPDNGPPTNVRLGAIFNNAENFQGDLDDVRFYNRAITAAEVTALSQGFE
jgi:hypothetical protein